VLEFLDGFGNQCVQSYLEFLVYDAKSEAHLSSLASLFDLLTFFVFSLALTADLSRPLCDPLVGNKR
jgi:hypothetical protein